MSALVPHDRFATRWFPRSANVRRYYDRFAASIEQMVLQSARLVPVPWEEALREVLRRVEITDLQWWIYGSAALAVRGLPVEPGDIDIYVSDAALHRRPHRDGALGEPVVPVPPLSAQARVCERRGLTGRADLIRSAMRRSSQHQRRCLRCRSSKRLPGAVPQLEDFGRWSRAELTSRMRFVNDRRANAPRMFGHLAGSHCMRRVGAITRRWAGDQLLSRPFSICATFGGDEVIAAAAGVHTTSPRSINELAARAVVTTSSSVLPSKNAR